MHMHAGVLYKFEFVCRVPGREVPEPPGGYEQRTVSDVSEFHVVGRGEHVTHVSICVRLEVKTVVSWHDVGHGVCMKP